MYIEEIELKNFRNYEKLNIKLSRKINIFYGDNAQGKTNLLEAIYFMAIGRSYRTSNDKELIKFDKKISSVSTIINDNEIKDKVEIIISDSKNKRILLNGLGIKKLGELLGSLLIVSFSPEDLQLIKQGPGERRRFIDIEICQISKVYYYELKRYNHVLKQRNKLLKRIKSNNKLKDTLFAFDMQLINHGKKIMNYRESYVKELDNFARDVQKKLTKNKEELEIKYKGFVTEEKYEEKMEKSLEKDIMFGNTSVGIHKDDINFFINGIDVKKYGSQGQQRTALLSTKLAQIEIIKKNKHTMPILLLDDVLSELDNKRQKFLIENISDIQTIITSTGLDDFILNFKDEYSLFFIENGTIKITK